MSAHPHPTHGPPGRGAAFALLTISDTRCEDDDVSGKTMRRLVEAAGHRVHQSAIVSDDQEAVRARIAGWAAEPACESILCSGGTGLSARDRTVEAVRGLFDLDIEGFGELFRHLSFQQVGSAAMLSRATAGIVSGTPVFLLPGSPAAVELALTRLILPEIGHILGELRKHGRLTP